jgi:RimJ/RimL family protein N-acetyltransferase
VSADDLAVFYEHQLDKEASQMAEFPTRDWDAFMAHWKKIMSDPANILKTIVYDGQIAGNIVSWEHEGEQEVGYWIGREYWGRGIATAALKQFLEWVSIRPLYAFVVKDNIASRRVLEKCGFVLYKEDDYGFSFRYE